MRKPVHGPSPFIGARCTRHPERPARAFRGKRALCRVCAEAGVPGMKLTPDGWRHTTGSLTELVPAEDFDGPAELPIL
jgi:hypothetical protein